MEKLIDVLGKDMDNFGKDLMFDTWMYWFTDEGENKVSFKGTIDHPMSGYMDRFNEIKVEFDVVRENGVLKVKGNGLRISGPFEDDERLYDDPECDETPEELNFEAKNGIELLAIMNEMAE